MKKKKILIDNFINIIVGPNSSGKTTYMNEINNKPLDFFLNDFSNDRKYYYSINTNGIDMENIENGNIIKGTYKENPIKNEIISNELLDKDLVSIIFETTDRKINIVKINNDNSEKNKVVNASTGIDKYFYFEYIFWDIKNKFLNNIKDQMKSAEFYAEFIDALATYDFDLEEYFNLINQFEISIEKEYLNEGNKLSFIEYLIDEIDIYEDEWLEGILNLDFFEKDILEKYYKFSKKILNFVKIINTHNDDLKNEYEKNLKKDKNIIFLIKYFDITNYVFLGRIRKLFEKDLKFEFIKHYIKNIEFDLLFNEDMISVLKKIEEITDEIPFNFEEYKVLLLIDEIENSFDRLRIESICKKIKSYSNLDKNLKVTFVISTHSVNIIKKIGFEKTNIVRSVTNKLSNFKKTKINNQDFKKILFFGNNFEFFFNRKLLFVEGYNDYAILDLLNNMGKINLDGYALIFMDGLKNLAMIIKEIKNNSFFFDEVLILIDEDINKKDIKEIAEIDDGNPYQSNLEYFKLKSIQKSSCEKNDKKCEEKAKSSISRNKKIYDSLNISLNNISETKIKIVTHLFDDIKKFIEFKTGISIKNIENLISIEKNISAHWKKDDEPIWEFLYEKVDRNYYENYKNKFGFEIIENDIGIKYSLVKKDVELKKVFGPHK